MSQTGNRINASTSALQSSALDEDFAPAVIVGADEEGAPPPVRQIDAAALRSLGAHFKALHDTYASERIPAEQKWLKSLRQYLGEYDPEVSRTIPADRSKAYPRLTRMKCISMLSRLMNLMFPGNEDNWELQASPSPSMSPEAVASAVSELLQEIQVNGEQAELTQELLEEAVRRLADKQAAKLTKLIKDQLMELGGNQTVDWVTLNRKVVDSGIRYGIGVLEGPFVREVQESGWIVAEDGQPKPVTRKVHKPQYDVLPVWDFYPDMSARDFRGSGYFKRKILSRSALRRLATRPDFFESQIKGAIEALREGNYRARSWETELRGIGVSAHAADTPGAVSGRDRFEIIIWKGPISAHKLEEAGLDVPQEFKSDDVEAELWMVDNWIIKAEINAWRRMGVQVDQVHIFSFDDDDTSPIGQGLPAIVRDSQLSICAVTRMVLDNASVTCGPNLEVNTSLLRADQDLVGVQAYKVWYRDDDGPSTQFPAVRELKFDGHINELQSLARMFMEFAEMETFIGPATGGDFQKMPSEPMRTAAGASMLRGDASLPFKDIVRNYDAFTQSVIWSLVKFNNQFNPDEAPQGDYDVIPRGATSLIAKEVRGSQIDMLSQTLTPDERDHVDERKFVEAKFASRDMLGMLVSEDVAARNKSARAQTAAEQAELQKRGAEAEIRKTLSDAYKNIAQGQKNAANADQVAIKTATDMISNGEAPNEPERAPNRTSRPST